MKKRWTEKELDFIKKNRRTMDFVKMGEKLGRTPVSVRVKSYSIPYRARWSEEDDEVLLELLGTATIKFIAGKLSRSTTAVIRRLERLGVSNMVIETGTYRTYEFADIIGVNPKTIHSWIKDKGLPAHQFFKENKKNDKARHHYIFAHEFWSWAKKNKSFIHFGKIERDVLIPEPAWLDSYIEEETKAERHQSEWTTGEDKRLIDLIVNQEYSQHAAGEELGRSRRAVQKRVEVLRKENRWPGSKSRACPWTEEQILTAINLRSVGKTYKQIGAELGRTERSVGAKLKSLGH